MAKLRNEARGKFHHLNRSVKDIYSFILLKLRVNTLRVKKKKPTSSNNKFRHEIKHLTMDL